MFLIGILLAFILNSEEGTIQFSERQKINGTFTKIYADAWNNCYLINDKKHLLKISPKGDTLYSYQSKVNQITYCDVSNPLRILAYDEAQNQLVILDKTLTENGNPIFLDDFNILNSKAVASSRNNQFWVFDENFQELKKIDLNLSQVASSGQLTNFLSNSFYPTHILQENNSVFVADSTNGVIEFDQNGVFISELKLKAVGKFQLRNNQLIYLKNDSLQIIDTHLLDQNSIALPQKNIIDFSISKNNLFLLTKEKVYIYDISL